MKYQLAIFGCLLLLWTLTESQEGAKKDKITVKKTGNGIQLACSDTTLEIKNWDRTVVNTTLEYKDENSGEYSCGEAGDKIYVKFRTCDNCIELDQGSVIGMVVGDIVATIVIGVAVYLIASQDQIRPNTSQKRSSDRQHLVPREGGSRGPNDHYEQLRPKGGQKDTYDVITNRK
ncbi:hypothetical protein Q5P01_009939 [Channa striata]|uniref:Uncharacterized protein n=1 Tax=Channa striata TaxID=64152 RepID=A0AA88SSQ0_CHASR|nr:hypothetical protein Q5P01_009939 [Channa striata]